MLWQNAALALAGLIGGATAIVHGVLIQRLMVRPIEAAASTNLKFSRPIRRMIAPLLHFSTVVWLAGGVALVTAAFWLDRDSRLATCLWVGGAYAFGAIFNCYATRGRHPGWILMAAALMLIVLGANKPIV